ncbi:hypothetical protein MIZ03_0168 [Rhodoferax lithotrophicus]|uniref:Uncharacterized protein n=1 Tax=Rhodoferax lithotrophicus TaxID=2798804 RepID=A0ABN6D103_9BURK|nr:hypothetical protein MIZ03_0168 [Rhodoferax sp. MIZ03]
MVSHLAAQAARCMLKTDLQKMSRVCTLGEMSFANVEACFVGLPL